MSRDGDGGPFRSGAVCTVGEQLVISGNSARGENHYAYQVYAVDQTCKKKFHELWVIEEERDQVAHGYPLLLTVQAFLTTYVSPAMKDDQLKAMADLHWMTTVAATKVAVEELFAQCTKTAKVTEDLSIQQMFRQLTLHEENEMVFVIAPSWTQHSARSQRMRRPFPRDRVSSPCETRCALASMAVGQTTRSNQSNMAVGGIRSPSPQPRDRRWNRKGCCATVHYYYSGGW